MNVSFSSQEIRKQNFLSLVFLSSNRTGEFITLKNNLEVANLSIKMQIADSISPVSASGDVTNNQSISLFVLD